MSEKLTLFDRLGGTRRMADLIGEPPSTVQSWKSAGRIPAGHQPKVLERAREVDGGITAEDIIFPMGREFAPEWPVPSATNGGDNIPSETDANGEADSPRPFPAGGEASPPTSSSTCPSSAGSATSSPRPCSTGPAESEAEAA